MRLIEDVMCLHRKLLVVRVIIGDLALLSSQGQSHRLHGRGNLGWLQVLEVLI